MKFYLSLYALVVMCFTGYTQNVVVQDANNTALTGVNIYHKNSEQFAVTNSEGKADISAFPEDGAIEFSLIGFGSYSTTKSQLQSSNNLVTLSVSEISLNEVLISATKWKQDRREIPNRITSISAREVEFQNPQTAADLLAISGEVFIQKSQLGGGSPLIRGFATNRLLYSVDGVRFNTAIFRGGNIQNVISLDPFAIENTEVLFGPGSVIYGSDAVGAVMSFQTLTPELSLNDEPLVSGKANLRYASASNENTAHVDVNVGWKKWAILSSFSSNDYGDLRMGANGPDEYKRPFYVQRIDSTDVVVANPDPLVQNPTGYSQINLMQKVRFKPNKDWDFEYAFHYAASSSYARYDRHIRLRNGLPRSGEWKYGPQIWQKNQLSVGYKKSNNFFNEANLRIAHQLFKESRIDRDFNKTTRATRAEEVNAFSVNLDFEKFIAGNQKLYYGAEVVTNDVASNGIDTDISTGTSKVGPSRYPNATWASYAAYLNYDYRFNQQFLIQIGTRYNQYNIDADFSNNAAFYPFPFEQSNLSSGALTGSAGLVYTPTESWIISANASTAFRAPNVDDAGKIFDSEAGSVVVPNINLNPEYAYNGELNISKVFGKRLKVSISGYYTLLQDALVRRDFQLNGADSIVYDGELSQVQAIQNAASANVYGAIASIELSLAPGLLLSSNINFQKGEEELDNGTKSPLRHAAPTFGLTRLTYTKEKVKLQFYANYSAQFNFEDLAEVEQEKDFLYASDANGNSFSPSWYTLNFKMQYQFNETFSISSGIENITDQGYRPYSSGVAGAGRNFILSAKASF